MADTAEAEKVLRGQADALGLKVDKRWSVETLAEKVLEAQYKHREADKAAFEAAKKVPVLLRKDAFPLEDVRVKAGETVNVPVDVARYWISRGIAERADPLPGE